MENTLNSVAGQVCGGTGLQRGRFAEGQVCSGSKFVTSFGEEGHV